MASKGDILWSDKVPGPGWVPTGRQTKNGTWVQFIYEGKQRPNPTPTGGPGGGGGGGGGTASEGLSQYVQAYRLNFFPEGSPPPGLLQRAKDNRWSVAYFMQQVRRTDPKYYKSLEARTVLPSFNRTMKVLFPGLNDRTRQQQLMKSPFYKRLALWYLKEGVGLTKNGEELLYNKITGTKRWRENNPYWRDYVRNAAPAVASEANPLLYKAHLDTLKNAFKEYGMELPEDYYRTFFKSRYASQDTIGEMQQNLKTLAQGKGSFEWWQGRPMGSGQVKQTIFGGNQQADLKNRLAKAFNVQASFLSQEESAFGTSQSDKGKLIKPLI